MGSIFSTYISSRSTLQLVVGIKREEEGEKKKENSQNNPIRLLVFIENASSRAHNSRMISFLLCLMRAARHAGMGSWGCP